MTFTAFFYKDGKIFSINTYKNVKNKKQAISLAKEDAKNISCEKYEIIKK